MKLDKPELRELEIIEPFTFLNSESYNSWESWEYTACHRCVMIVQPKVCGFICETCVTFKERDTERFLLYLNQPVEQAPILAGYPCWLQEPRVLDVEVPREKGLNELFYQLQETSPSPG